MSQGVKKFVQNGVPMIALCVAGLYGLTELQQGKLDYRDVHNGKVDDRAPVDKQYFQKHKKNVKDEDLLSWLRKKTLDAGKVEHKPIERPDYDNPDGIH